MKQIRKTLLATAAAAALTLVVGGVHAAPQSVPAKAAEQTNHWFVEFDSVPTIEGAKLDKVRGEKAAFPPGEAREDWAILRAVSELAGKTLPFDSFGQLRQQMVAEYPELGRDGLIELPWAPPKLEAKAEGPIRYPIGDFFLTNAICRASPTMHRCSEELVQGTAFKEAAE